MGQAKKDTKSKILKAARKLFVKGGFNGTSMAAIRDLAGVNHALLFYYFKNKENLWDEVRHSIVEDSKIYDKVLPKGDLKAKDFIKGFVENFAKFNVDHPDMLSLLNWQRLEGGKITVGDTPSFKAWIEAFESYQKKGQMKNDFNAPYLIYTILSTLCASEMDNCAFIKGKEGQRDFVKYITESAMLIALP